MYAQRQTWGNTALGRLGFHLQITTRNVAYVASTAAAKITSGTDIYVWPFTQGSTDLDALMHPGKPMDGIKITLQRNTFY
jgi:hypothetical protein